jgi:hypothetical protein
MEMLKNQVTDQRTGSRFAGFWEFARKNSTIL